MTDKTVADIMNETVGGNFHPNRKDDKKLPSKKVEMPPPLRRLLLGAFFMIIIPVYIWVLINLIELKQWDAAHGIPPQKLDQAITDIYNSIVNSK